jgi:HD-like signal output (HDOD) protein
MRKDAYTTAAAFAEMSNGNAAASTEAISFIQELAGEVAGGVIVLPSYPDVALRVQRVLADPNANESLVIKIIGAEPILAARVINMANSAALNPSGRPVAELRSALARVGFDALRSAAIGFAIAQLRKAAAYRAIEKPMTALWQQNTSVAATCYILSRKLRRFAPDTSMLAGLVSGVGKLYILTRASKYPALFGDAECYQALVRDWHPNVARSLLENWGMAEEIVDAVADCDYAPENAEPKAGLADLLACAGLLVSLKDSPDLLQARVQTDRAAQRIGLTTENCSQLLQDSVDEIASLRAALTG